MPTKIPYSARKEDLFHPCHQDAVFFQTDDRTLLRRSAPDLSRLVYGKFESTDHDKQKVLGILQEQLGFGRTVSLSRLLPPRGFSPPTPPSTFLC